MSASEQVLAVCHHRRNLELLVQFLQREGYATCQAATLEEIDQVLEECNKLALALLDLSGFDARMWKRCDQLHQAGVPFLLISAGRSTGQKQEGLRRGARGVLDKPLAMQELSGLIASLMNPPLSG